MTTHESLILLGLVACVGVGADGAEEPASSENIRQVSQITQPDALNAGVTLGRATPMDTDVHYALVNNQP